jgi:hypothetical protein
MAAVVANVAVERRDEACLSALFHTATALRAREAQEAIMQRTRCCYAQWIALKPACSSSAAPTPTRICPALTISPVVSCKEL